MHNHTKFKQNQIDQSEVMAWSVKSRSVFLRFKFLQYLGIRWSHGAKNVHLGVFQDALQHTLKWGLLQDPHDPTLTCLRCILYAMALNIFRFV